MKYSTLLIVPVVGLAMSSAAFAGSYGKDMGYHDKQQKMEQRSDSTNPIDSAPNAIIRAAREDQGLFVPDTGDMSNEPVKVAEWKQNDSINDIVGEARADHGRFVPRTQSTDYDVVGLGEADYDAPNRVIEGAIQDHGRFVPQVEGQS